MDWIEIRDMLGLDITPDQLRKQAVGYEEYDNYIHGFSGVATTILSISDLHVPFQLDYELLENYRNVDILQINGDVVDCQAISKFPKQYRISPMNEMIEGRQYLIDLIKYVNPKKVFATSVIMMCVSQITLLRTLIPIFCSYSQILLWN